MFNLIRTKQQSLRKSKNQKGASMIEYALIIAGVVVVAALLFGGDNGGTVGKAITDKVDEAVGSTTTGS